MPCNFFQGFHTQNHQTAIPRDYSCWREIKQHSSVAVPDMLMPVIARIGAISGETKTFFPLAGL